MDQKQTRLQLLLRYITRLERNLAALHYLSNRYSWARLGVFVAAVIAAIGGHLAAGTWLAAGSGIVGMAAFVGVAYGHRRIKNSITRHQIWLKIKKTHVARMQLDWDNLPPAFITTPRREHPIETDLDLVGEMSMHRLVDNSVSRDSSIRLRDWLTSTEPDLVNTQKRQAAVSELIPLTAFRDKLRLYATVDRKRQVQRWDSRTVFDWLSQTTPTMALSTVSRWLTLLAVTNIVLFGLTALVSLPPLWYGTFIVYLGLYLWTVQEMGDPFKKALALTDPLNDLQSVFRHLESFQQTQNPQLARLCAPFHDSQQRPSAHLAQITRLLSAASLRGNPIFWLLISAVMPWDVYVMHALNKKRAAVGELLPQWLDIWFELEALSSLANLGYLNPHYVFPVFHDDAQQPLLQASRLGHPLIPDSKRVCNDFTLPHSGDLAMITGSNMSGKSTFLRTIGVNLCLAYAGGPVNAASLITAPVRLFTCIRVTDSVTDGISYFYAEVKRLKALLSALEAENALPVLFLIDEIFRGTNNRERLIGSRSYVRTVVGRNGAGVLSTHDLELIQLADGISHITNYHFAETIVDDRMSFDYRLRPGPCPSTNALQIMRMEGLPVELA
ncbi:MAG: hypothetical protein JW966_13875 [Anaerolineae bacterium]|nr:hypothetical protein [Anaerolineae bacterium]